MDFYFKKKTEMFWGRRYFHDTADEMKGDLVKTSRSLPPVKGRRDYAW